MAFTKTCCGLLFAAVMTLGATGTATAAPPYAPSPGDFAGPVNCTLTIGKTTAENKIEIDLKLANKEATLLSVHKADPFYLTSMPLPVTDKRVSFSVNGSPLVPQIFIKEWDKDPNHLAEVSVVIRGTTKFQPYNLVGEYVPANGKTTVPLPQSALVTAAIGWDSCSPYGG